MADLEAQTWSLGGGPSQTVLNIEWVSGTQRADVFTGTDSQEALLGRNGNELLYGRGGIDQLYGEKGRDRLFAEDGLGRWSKGDVMSGVPRQWMLARRLHG